MSYRVASVGPVSVDYKIDGYKNLNRYDGPTASDSQSDLDDSMCIPVSLVQ